MVSTDELKRMMTYLGNPLTDQEVRDIVREAGSDDGKLDYGAFCKLLGVGIRQERKEDPEEEMQHAFSIFDRDRDGFISPKEMTATLKDFGVTLSEKEVDKVRAAWVGHTHTRAPGARRGGGGVSRHIPPPSESASVHH